MPPMSIQGNVGAEAAAREILAYIEALRAQPEFKNLTPHDVAERIAAKAEDIRQTAQSGWY